MTYERAGRSGGTTKTSQNQGVVVDFVSQKPLEIGENPEGLSHSIHGRSSGLLRVAAVQLSRLDPEDRASLRKYVERDLTKMEASNG